MREVVPFRRMKKGHPVHVKGLRGSFIFVEAIGGPNGSVDHVVVHSIRTGTRCVTPDRIIKHHLKNGEADA